mgnify:CR=1 FL=1
MNRAEKAMVEKNLDLLFEFERHIAERPSSVRGFLRMPLWSCR